MSCRYTFELFCPRCGAGTQATLYREDIIGSDEMAFNCGDCLMEAVEVIKLTIEKVTVEGVR